MTCECDREQDVLDAITARRWPDRCDRELSEHVAGCAVCRDLAEITLAIAAERDAAWSDGHIPPAGVVWWRAQLRAREDKARAATRPVAFVHGVAASVAVWLIVSIYRALPAGYWSEWLASITSSLPRYTFTMADIARIAAAVPGILLVLVAVWLVLAPVAIYFAAADE